MALVTKIEMMVEGVEYTYNVNVTKKGLFRCHLDATVASALGLKGNLIEAYSLDKVEGYIKRTYHSYLEATKTFETYIMIKYKANGEYARETKFPHNNLFSYQSEFREQGFASQGDCLRFSFDVIIKQINSTGTIQWYEARKGQGCVNFNEGDLCDKDTWYRSRETYGISNKSKLIPYSKEAYDTLQKAVEGVRGISEILYGVLSKEDKEIEQILTKGKLLNK